ncbi:MAG: malto-oligosyltrehalose synthase, partial [Pseudomonadota bacterium]|nr:malto-oligosyltrehalose synthase [Pseudomonadota bacterium]
EGEALRRHALFEALQEHFHRDDHAVWGWPVWPEAYRTPDAEAVAQFARDHAERVEYYQYLQWQAADQLQAAGRRSLELGLGVGIYQDLAVSIDGGGAEAWAGRDAYALEARVGAPPDEFSRKGQNWGLPPLIPDRLFETGYAPFIAMLRHNMRYAGALRIDHVMGLMRLYWIPEGFTPAQGAYVSYPLDDLVGILALESRRNQCMVIGEDLGTVPDALRTALAKAGVLSYRLLYFEKNYDTDGGFKAPEQYPAQALVSISTHDLPTLAGFWAGVDVDVRSRLDLFPSDAVREEQVVVRAQDLARLLVALERESLLPPGATAHPVSAPEMTPELCRAVHAYLARTPSRIMVVQMEDVFLQPDQVNLPGTVDQYPNWRRKLALNLEDWLADPRLQALAATLAQTRGARRAAAAEAPAESRGPFPARGLIPRATYRFQFHSRFTFAQAAELAPYLHQLGVSHCYASPYLRARPGSTHGYDIIDHNALNPEVGSDEDFERFSGALRDHGLGQILDMVPNHMGVMSSDNAWWLDVLENGPSAAHAGFFDIDWRPFKEELRGKVLLPVLGDQYGVVLESGELKLAFDADAGTFSVLYHQHRFPVDPQTYARILGHRPERLTSRLGEDDLRALELQSLATAFANLPGQDCDPERAAERNRDKEIHKRHLAELCRQSPDLAWFVEETVQEFNATPGEAVTFDLLHGLLEVQAYRLAYWRVAADDINYRRFFDINDLAGLRMENPEAFRTTHRRVLSLIADGRLDGLRIDHPDGLFDPVGYFQALQDCFAGGDGGTTKPLYVVVEKILESYERLPEDWPVHGTTGYDFANAVNAVLVDGTSEEAMTAVYQDFIGERIAFEELLYRCKMLIMKVALASELNVLANRLSRIAQADRRSRDFTLTGLRDTLREVVACFPVYRTYITAAGWSNEDQRYIDWAVSKAKKRSTAADTSVFDFVRDVLLTTAAEGKAEDFRHQVVEFAMKFQQYTGPVMAKGLEDTSFYIYNRLASLNEVGGDPLRYAVSVAGFHHMNQDRVKRWPHAMLSTSTHDSKRSEDVRARIDVLSELADEWGERLQRWGRLNGHKKRLVDNAPAPSRNDEYLLYQSLLGVWPLEEPDAAGLEDLRRRLEAYMLKAIKEAKVHSSWINPHAGYEEAIAAFVRVLLENPDKNRFLHDFLPLQRRVARFGLFNSLSQTLLKLTCPGVPDVYQGNELWDFSLVDPDNRRPVDYGRRQALLRQVQENSGGPLEAQVAHAYGLLESMADGRIKLFVTWKLLALRRDRPEVFQHGDYTPLEAAGDKAEHVIAFARRHAGQEMVVATPRLYARLLAGSETALPLSSAAWGDTRLRLAAAGPETAFANVFTSESVTVKVDDEDRPCLPLAAALAHFPLAVLVREA